MQKGGNAMDQVRIGSFIAQLRREKGWTQEELGEQLCVTNKTFSRWENGNYMPNIEVLTLLSKKFEVSLNELLEGRRLDDDADFRAVADKNLVSALEQPYDRFWRKMERWLGRYGAFPLVTLALCMLLVMCCVGMLQYRRAHPADVRAAGTYYRSISDYPGEGEYIVLLKHYEGDDSTYWYYRYRQFEALERGDWQADGAMVTAAVDEKSLQMLIKGDCLYVPDDEGRLIVYQKIADYGIFNSIRDEDFEK